MTLPIRTRLTITYTCVATVLVGLLGAVLYAAMVLELNEAADHDMRVRADGIADFLEKKINQGKIATLPQEFHEDEELNLHGSPLQIFDGDKRTWIYRSPTSIALKLDSIPVRDAHSRTERFRHRTLRIYDRRVVIDSRTFWIEVALDRSEYAEALRHLASLLLLGTPITILLAAFLGYWLSGRALRRVEIITDAVHTIDSRHLSLRLPLSGAGDELDRLSQTLNTMLDRLQGAFDRIARFTADASHELRTPLSLIRSTSEMLRIGARNPALVQRRSDTILSEVDRMTALVEGLLALARSDNGEGALPMELLDPLELLERAAAQGKRLAEMYRIRFELRPPSSIFPVEGNASAIERVIVILLENAMRHTGETGEVALRVTSTDKELRLEVADTGCGIAAEHHARIFDRFYRVDEARSRSDGGAGLGLALAKSIVELHRGSITVESAPGAGATFRVVLPSCRVVTL